jgi:phage tail sheath gpL-like
MASIIVPGFSSSTKTPGFYAAVILGGPGTSAGAAPITELHLGNMIGTAITGSSPTLSVAAGTASTSTPYPVYSPAGSALLFGAGSELHLMALAAFAHDPACTLVQMATAQGSTVSMGTATVAFTSGSNPTGPLTIAITVCGRTCYTSTLGTSDTATTVATAICVAINSQTNWPVTAQYSAGVVTITAKHTGLRGQNINCRFLLQYSTSSSFAGSVASSLVAATLQNTILTLTTFAAQGGVALLQGGTTEESLTTPLAAIAGTRYNRYVCAQQGSTALAAISAQVTSMAGVSIGYRQQAVVASVVALSSAITLAAAVNNPRVQMAWSYNNDLTTGEIAASVCAVRVAGDAVLVSVSPRLGEGSTPSANLDGANMLVPPQYAVADQPTATQIESALNHGLTPVAPLGNSGKSALVRSVTTFYLDASSNPTFAVIDTEFVTTCDAVADALQSQYVIDFSGFNVVADPSDGSAVKIAKTTTPSGVQAWLYKWLKSYEAQGWIQQVDAKKSQLSVILDPSVSGRLLANIPVFPASNLHQLAGAVIQLSN